jgi:polysaccharide export outer membrane protein
LPLLAQPVHADGQSTFEFSKQLAAILKEQQILKEPYVTVFIERGMTQQITISGPVARPGIYPIEHTTRLLDVLGMSGGLLPGAGQTITVVRPMAAEDSPTTIKGGVTEIDVGTLMSGQKPESNIEVHAGDQITIAGSSIVYVVGAVIRPGAFTVQDPRFGMSVLRALALVEGAQPTASLSKAIIVRHSTSDVVREEIPLDLGKIMKGQEQDPVLLANDILFVPQSGLKLTLKKMGEIATIAAGQAVGYGLGLQIAHH